MVYQNEFDITGKSAADGGRAEANFVDIFTARFGVAPVKATLEQDKYDHIDYFMIIDSHRASVDVKSWKHDEKYVWVELVSYGRLGWLYGKADFIAFESPDEQSFMMVNREELVSLIKQVCIVQMTDNKEEALFRPYIRYKGKDFERYDCVTKIPREYLSEVKHWILKKDK